MPGGGRSSSSGRCSSSSSGSSGYFSSHRRQNPQSEYEPFQYMTTGRSSYVPPTDFGIMRKAIWATIAIISSATLLLIPARAVRARLDAENAAPGGRPAPSMIAMGKMIWRQEGIKGLFKGGSVQMIKFLPSVALAMATCALLENKSTSRDVEMKGSVNNEERR